MLSEIDESGVVSDMSKIKQYFVYIILQDDIYEGMTKAALGGR